MSRDDLRPETGRRLKEIERRLHELEMRKLPRAVPNLTQDVSAFIATGSSAFAIDDNFHEVFSIGFDVPREHYTILGEITGGFTHDTGTLLWSSTIRPLIDGNIPTYAGGYAAALFHTPTYDEILNFAVQFSDPIGVGPHTLSIEALGDNSGGGGGTTTIYSISVHGLLIPTAAVLPTT